MDYFIPRLPVKGFNLEKEMSQYASSVLEGDWKDVSLPVNGRKQNLGGLEVSTTTETGVNPDDDVSVVIFGVHREARRGLLSRDARLSRVAEPDQDHIFNSGTIPEDEYLL